MKTLMPALLVVLAAALVHAEDVWRWKDERGAVHYSNVARNVPRGATVVDTRITLEVARLPGAPKDPDLTISGGQVSDAGEQPAPGALTPQAPRWFKPLPDAPRIYDDERLRFGCFSAGILYFGGFAHPDDISPELNCYPYRLGPEAWLNAARAELAMRQNGIRPRDILQLYGELTGKGH